MPHDVSEKITQLWALILEVIFSNFFLMLPYLINDWKQLYNLGCKWKFKKLIKKLMLKLIKMEQNML